ncbi:hypothetical protein BDQ17DRAFT_1330703 [Cyathus striatus]|nr:hypothetical protein BDQ17DRAFT_1330703 [Cyathus striatus]
MFQRQKDDYNPSTSNIIRKPPPATYSQQENRAYVLSATAARPNLSAIRLDWVLTQIPKWRLLSRRPRIDSMPNYGVGFLTFHPRVVNGFQKLLREAVVLRALSQKDDGNARYCKPSLGVRPHLTSPNTTRNPRPQNARQGTEHRRMQRLPSHYIPTSLPVHPPGLAHLFLRPSILEGIVSSSIGNLKGPSCGT